jgi:sugar/nucleoside kinase (ribokinase family)
MAKYIIAGCAAIDHIITREGRQLPPQLGGSGIFAAVGANIWSKEVGLVALTHTTFPAEKIALLQANGIDTSGVVNSGKKLGLEGTIRYLPDGTREIGASKGLLLFLQNNFPSLISMMGKAIWPKVCPSAQLIPGSFLDGAYGLVASMAHVRQAEFLAIFSKHFQRTILDPAPLLPGMKALGIPSAITDLSGADFVLPSEQELKEYFGSTDNVPGAREFFKHGAGGVVIKKGSAGGLLFQKENAEGEVLPIYAVPNPIDVTGAGDSFCGGFLVGLGETGDPRKAALYGAVSASFVIEGYGAEYALTVSRDKAEERLSAIKS